MWWEMPRLFLSLIRLLRRERVDVMRADDSIVTSLPVVVAGKLSGIPTYVFLAGAVKETAMEQTKKVPVAARLVGELVGRIENRCFGRPLELSL